MQLPPPDFAECPPAAPFRFGTHPPIAIKARLPGLSAATLIATLAMLLHAVPGITMLSPAVLSILLGIVLRQLIGQRPSLRPGLAFCTRGLLRFAVVLLGLQVTLAQIAALGFPILLAIAASLMGCFLGTLWLGRILGVSPRLAQLIAAGTSICGASAVVAANSVIKAEEEDVAYALAAVTLFGTISMVAIPLFAALLGMDSALSGLWSGASIHEVAQVAGAASQIGDQAPRTAVIAKMVRILLLAPMILGLNATLHTNPKAKNSSTNAQLAFPWFIVGFLTLVTLNSLENISPAIIRDCGLLATFALAIALAAMGFSADLQAIRRQGLRPLLLAFLAWLLIAAISLAFLKFSFSV